MGHSCYLCIVFFMFLRLFVVAIVVSYWKRADLLALVGGVYCIFVTFQCGFIG